MADLLGRQEVNLDRSSISNYIYGKRVLVTGAGGSIGAELCKQIIKLSPKKIIILDHSEFSVYNINNLLKAKFY